MGGVIRCSPAPVLAVFIYFKLAVVPTDTFATSQGLRATASRLADISRHVLILRAFVRDGILLAGWTSSVALVATAYLLLLGLNRTHLRDRSVLTIVGVLVLMLGGYWIVYAITPFPIHWHLRTSPNRLLLQLWPTGVFALFLFVSEGPKAPAAPLLGDRIKP